METTLKEKQDWLDGRLRELGSLLVAYSGGVDSVYLAWRPHQVLGKTMLAVLSVATFECGGFQSGSMNLGLPAEVLNNNSNHE